MCRASALADAVDHFFAGERRELFAKSSLLSPAPPFLPQKLFPGRMKNVRNVAGHLLTDGLPAAWQKNAFPAVGETLFFTLVVAACWRYTRGRCQIMAL